MGLLRSRFSLVVRKPEMSYYEKGIFAESDTNITKIREYELIGVD